jgi:hypothetical protein
MPTVIGRTDDGREILRYHPSEGCAWRCVTCGNYLYGRNEVRGHWALFSEGHSVFERRSDRALHHQTIEGLHRRDWEVPVAEPYVVRAVSALTPPWAFEIGQRFQLHVPGSLETVPYEVVGQGLVHGRRAYRLLPGDRDCLAPQRIHTEAMLLALLRTQTILDRLSTGDLSPIPPAPSSPTKRQSTASRRGPHADNHHIRS